jgi:hypothetical protein
MSTNVVTRNKRIGKCMALALNHYYKNSSVPTIRRYIIKSGVVDANTTIPEMLEALKEHIDVEVIALQVPLDKHLEYLIKAGLMKGTDEVNDRILGMLEFMNHIDSVLVDGNTPSWNSD